MQILTKDASITLYNMGFDEAYHNVNDGALQETLHKHILPALALKKESQTLNVLDICFGLGFNALSLQYAIKKFGFNGRVNVDSPEINGELLNTLRNHPYPKELECAGEVIDILQHKQEYHKENFHLFLHLGDAREILKEFLDAIKTGKREKFNVIFQDPFSPFKNHHLWTFEYFKTLYVLSSNDVIVTTYSHNSCMLYSAFLAGFYSFKLVQKNVRDSIIFMKVKEIPKELLQTLDFAEKIVAINIENKIKANPNLKGLYD
ncbi:hypothetical protein LS70_005565 [Helicobacter sp. MIT 11-5569]|uniref:MnmC family methyltransferase n=1 Tax=Helicobacter sp. MIT 11-5569 TaxID=1548151 RepID=UPI00051F8D3A|nr:MnmC family methyltransferase [Helicobacter sp. MIT 11-5569]TLD83217.1 hypothetical protein LS70_005565 [Helicobacter sp. MIT 11-5569]